MAKARRVKFEFDHRSLANVNDLEQQGHFDMSDSPACSAVPEITFEFEGKRYGASMSFYNTNRCQLPDGTMLECTDWLETVPPKPAAVHRYYEYGLAYERP